MYDKETHALQAEKFLMRRLGRKDNTEGTEQHLMSTSKYFSFIQRIWIIIDFRKIEQP